MIIRSAVFSVISLCFVVGPISAANVYVSKTGSNVSPYSSWATAARSIQDAVDVAGSYGTVWVDDGTYTPSSEISVTQNVSIYSVNGAAATIIDGSSSHRCFNLTATGCKVKGFTITRGNSTGNGGGIYVNNLNAVVANCIITHNLTGSNGGGVYNGAINNCVLKNNTAVKNGGAAGGSRLNNCTVINNYAYGNGGGMSYGRARNCIVWDNTAEGTGDNFNGSHTSTAYSCSPDLTAGVNGCVTDDPQFSDFENDNFHLLRTSPCYDAGYNSYANESKDLDGMTRIVGTVDMGAYELANNSAHVGSPIHYVSLTGSAVWPYTSLSTAARTIQDAVDVAEAGDEVLVDDGIYSSGGKYSYGLSRVVVSKSITIRGIDGPEETFIMGVIDPDTFFGNAAVRGLYITTDAVLSGFTVTNGCTWGSASTSGGGVYCTSYSPVITNCIVSGNYAFANGGGIYKGSVSDCTVSGNSSSSSGGGLYGSTAVRCAISDNSSAYNGGGLYNGSAFECTINDNHASHYGGGLYDGSVSNSLVNHNYAQTRGGGLYQTTADSCMISSNVSETGGGAYNSALDKCIVYYNNAVNGGGIYQGTADNSVFNLNVASINGGALADGAVADNCQIFGNRADQDGGGLHESEANNSCLYGNTAYGNGGAMASGTLRNCTVVDNTAHANGGGVSYGTVFNSIVYFNRANISGDNFNSNYATVSYSCSPELTSGVNGCITNNPHLSGVANGDCHLLRTSPCGNSGNNTDAPSGNDMDGNPRIIEGIVDMGAYELVSAPSFDSGTSPTHYVSKSGSATWPYTSWATAAGTIQDAVDVAADGDTVMVNDGIYSSGGVSDEAGTSRVSIKKSIALQSLNGADHTVISGAAAAGVNRHDEACVRCVYLSGNATISGFTISGGYTTASGSTADKRRYGGGILCESSDDIVRDCTITGNAADRNGGGMCYGTLYDSIVEKGYSQYDGGGLYSVTAEGSTISRNQAANNGGGAALGTMSGCVFEYNQALQSGGGMSDGTAISSFFTNNMSLADGGGLAGTTAVNCEITDNHADQNGGGLYGGVATNCVINGNFSEYGGGGMCKGAASECAIVNNISESSGGGLWFVNASECMISNNTATVNGGGAAYGRAVRCVIKENTAHSNGGGLYDGYAAQCGIIHNFATAHGGGGYETSAHSCLIKDNIALKKGGGMYGAYATQCTVVDNYAHEYGGGLEDAHKAIGCIIWGNTAGIAHDDFDESLVSASTLNSCSPDMTHGVDGCITNNPLFVEAASDYHLQSGSPCIDAGNNAFVVVVTNDLDGNLRIINSTVDMGAYEYNGGTSGVDSDGDGFSDADEEIAGTSSSDPSDYFRITSIDGNTIHFNSLESRLYTLYWSTNLVEGVWTPVGAARPGIGGADSISGGNSFSSEFFKLEVTKP